MSEDLIQATSLDDLSQNGQLHALREALTEAWIAMNFMGDTLNGMDAVDECGDAVCNPSWERIKQIAPWLEDVDLDAVYRSRHQESIGACIDCGVDIQWCDPYEATPHRKKRCLPCSNARMAASIASAQREGDRPVAPRDGDQREPS